MSGCADGKHAVPPLPPLSSRPSTVSANHRYASMLATEESSFCSEAGSAAESAAELAWDESSSLGQEAAYQAAGSSSNNSIPGRDHVEKPKKYCPSAVRKAQAAAERAQAVKQKAGFPSQQASLTPSRENTPSGQVQVQMHSQNTCHLPQQLKPGQPLVLPLSRQKELAVEEEEPWLLAPLQKMDFQHSSASNPALPQHTLHAQHAHQSSSGMVPSSAQHSRHHASTKAQQNALKATPARDRSKVPPIPSTPDGRAGPTVRAAAKVQARRAVGLARGQVSRPACLSDSTAGQGSVAGPQTSSATTSPKAKAPAQAHASRTGAEAGHRLPDVAGIEAETSNSIEQQLLQQSLAKLDARLTSLAARCAGMHCTCCCQNMLCLSGLLPGLKHSTAIAIKQVC